MNRRARRNRRLQNRAWALLAALLPATVGWATDGSDGAATKADSTSTAAASSPSTTGDGVPNSARSSIPSPRRVDAAGLGAQRPVANQSKSKIPPPRPFVSIAAQPPLSVEPPAVEAQAPSVPKELNAPAGQDAAAVARSAEVPDGNVISPAAEPAAERALTPTEGASEVPIPMGGRPYASLTADEAPSQLAAAATVPVVEAATVPVAEAAAATGPAEPAPMPDTVNQALKTLATTPALGSDSALTPTPVSTPQPQPNSSAAPIPQQDKSQPQTVPTVASNSRADSSNADPAAIQSPTPNLAGQAPQSNATAPPQGQDDQVERTECATCGGYHSSSSGGIFHAQLGCAGGNCIPGRQPCSPSEKDCDTVFGAFFNNIYQELCCPDPCYQPKWEPGAAASFFADYARPRTVTRIRYDNLESMTTPDRNQYWIDSAMPKGMNGHRITNPRLRLQQVYLYQEAAAGNGSLFVEIPYRQINPNFEPSQSGFGDINFGIKSLMYDRELVQIGYQFRTYTPSGNFNNNLGTGHFSLDPSILTAIKLGPDTYFQGQFGNWIPLLGNSKLAGGIFYWFMSLNQALWYPRQDSPLIATLEMDGWSFENGGFTNAINKGQSLQTIEKGGGVTYFNIGPGLRQTVCNRLDFGGTITFATSTMHWAQPWFRFEVRFLF